jgi:hypothetical protein
MMANIYQMVERKKPKKQNEEMDSPPDTPVKVKVKAKVQAKAKAKIKIRIRQKPDIKKRLPKKRAPSKWNILQKANRALKSNKLSSNDLSDWYHAHKNLPTDKLVDKFNNPNADLVNVTNVAEFQELVGRYRLSYGGESMEVTFEGGTRNYKNFRDEYDATFNGALGEKLNSKQFSVIQFQRIPNRVPNKTVAKRNAARYNKNGFHCIWTPIALYHKRLADNTETDTKRRRKYKTFHKNKESVYRKLAEGKASDSETIQAVVDEMNIQITIEYVGFDSDNIEIFKHKDCQTKEKHYFICVRSDHVEYRHRVMDNDVILSEEDFEMQLSAEPMIHPVKIRKNKPGESLESEKRIYCFESYKDNTRYIREGYDHFLNPDADAFKYMQEMRKFSMPDDVPVTKLIRCSLRHPVHCYREGYFTRGRDGIETDIVESGLYETDAKKCFANFKLNKYYRGAPGKLNDWCWNPTADIYLQYPGFWYIDCDYDKMPFYPDKLTGAWTTVSLRYFHDQGIPFTVKFGAWSLQWVEIPEFSEEMIDKKLYSVIIGMLSRPGIFQKETKWLDPEHVIDIGSGIKVTSNKMSYKHCNMICAYFLDYAWTRVHEFAVQEDAVAIRCDAIITRNPVCDSLGWHASKPLDYSKEVVPIKFCVASKQITENINPFPSKLPYKYEHDLRCIKTNKMFLDGAGGTGKTTAAAHQYEYIGIAYCALAKAQVERFVGDGKPFQYGCNVHVLNYQKWLPGVVIIDEVSQLTLGLNDRKDGKKDPCTLLSIVSDAEKRGCRMIFAGDRAQIPINLNHSEEDPSEMWNYLNKMKTYCFQNDHRSQNGLTKQFKKKLREIVLSGNPDHCDQRKITEIRRLCRNRCKTFIPKTFDGLYLGNRKKRDDEDNYQSIDKTQGATISDPYCVRIDGNTHRKDIFHKLVYTGMSRCEDIGNVYVQDITNLGSRKD